MNATAQSSEKPRRGGKSQVEQDAKQQGDNFVEKPVALQRTAKVVKGGRTFSFSATTVVGDPTRGIIGLGRGKSSEVRNAMQKSFDKARKNTKKVILNGDTIWYPIMARHGATTVMLRPASEGTGIIAGGPMRAVFEVLGVKNILAKVYGSTNPVNVVYATINALTTMQTPEGIANKRGKTVEEIWDK